MRFFHKELNFGMKSTENGSNGWCSITVPFWKDYVDVSVEGAWNHLFIINKTSRYGKGLFIIFCDVLAT